MKDFALVDAADVLRAGLGRSGHCELCCLDGAGVACEHGMRAKRCDSRGLAEHEGLVALSDTSSLPLKDFLWSLCLRVSLSLSEMSIF